eukprot:9376721-Pyramimonas_sp.AAC.1
MGIAACCVQRMKIYMGYSLLGVRSNIAMLVYSTHSTCIHRPRVNPRAVDHGHPLACASALRGCDCRRSRTFVIDIAACCIQNMNFYIGFSPFGFPK